MTASPAITPFISLCFGRPDQPRDERGRWIGSGGGDTPASRGAAIRGAVDRKKGAPVTVTTTAGTHTLAIAKRGNGEDRLAVVMHPPEARPFKVTHSLRSDNGVVNHATTYHATEDEARAALATRAEAVERAARADGTHRRTAVGVAKKAEKPAESQYLPGGIGGISRDVPGRGDPPEVRPAAPAYDPFADHGDTPQARSRRAAGRAAAKMGEHRAARRLGYAFGRPEVQMKRSLCLTPPDRSLCLSLGRETVGTFGDRGHFVTIDGEVVFFHEGGGVGNGGRGFTRPADAPGGYKVHTSAGTHSFTTRPAAGGGHESVHAKPDGTTETATHATAAAARRDAAERAAAVETTAKADGTHRETRAEAPAVEPGKGAGQNGPIKVRTYNPATKRMNEPADVPAGEHAAWQGTPGHTLHVETPTVSRDPSRDDPDQGYGGQTLNTHKVGAILEKGIVADKRVIGHADRAEYLLKPHTPETAAKLALKQEFDRRDTLRGRLAHLNREEATDAERAALPAVSAESRALEAELADKVRPSMLDAATAAAGPPKPRPAPPAAAPAAKPEPTKAPVPSPLVVANMIHSSHLSDPGVKEYIQALHDYAAGTGPKPDGKGIGGGALGQIHEAFARKGHKINLPGY